MRTELFATKTTTHTHPELPYTHIDIINDTIMLQRN